MIASPGHNYGNGRNVCTQIEAKLCDERRAFLKWRAEDGWKSLYEFFDRDHPFGGDVLSGSLCADRKEESTLLRASKLMEKVVQRAVLRFNLVVWIVAAFIGYVLSRPRPGSITIHCE
jgi:hypothetical protein